jgi:hypothetical protein
MDEAVAAGSQEEMFVGDEFLMIIQVKTQVL